MEPFKLRAHHGMCLAFFIGKGYSSSFVENMSKQKEYLEQNNPTIEIVCNPDHICKKCLHNEKGRCTSIEKVDVYDHSVLSACQLKESTTMVWKDYSQLVTQKVFKTGKRKEICGNCEWNEICSELEKRFV